MDINKEIDKLIKEIKYHDNLYYNIQDPVISDSDYDKLKFRLKELEDKVKHIREDSPSINVSGNVSATFKRYLVTNHDSNNSKTTKAKELGISVISENKLLNMCQ